jgi:hypothetical protein
MLHQQNRRAVSEVIMPKTLLPHSLQNHTPGFALDAKLDEVRHTVTKTLQLLSTLRPTQRNNTENLHRLLVNVRKILLHPLNLQLQQETPPEQTGLSHKWLKT